MSASTRMIGFSLAAGVVFGFGLALSGMTDPSKIQGFLDFTAIPTGGWDPSLALVMAGALSTAFIVYRIAARRPRPILAGRFVPPDATEIDARLVGGSAIFGIGWGLSGLCPGPAIADLAIDFLPALIFVAAMMAGSWLVGALSRTGGYGVSLARAPLE